MNRNVCPKHIKKGVKFKGNKSDKGCDRAMNYSHGNARKWRPPQNHGRGTANTLKVGKKKGVRK